MPRCSPCGRFVDRCRAGRAPTDHDSSTSGGVDAACRHLRQESAARQPLRAADDRRRATFGDRARANKCPTGQTLPVVIAFHGAGGTGQFMASYSGLQTVSDGRDFVSVFPSAARPHRRWVLANEDEGGPADIQFVSALLDRVETLACTDATREVCHRRLERRRDDGQGGLRAGARGSPRSHRLPAATARSTTAGPTAPSRCWRSTARPTRSCPTRGAGPDHAGSVPGFLAQWRGFDHCPAADQHHRFGPMTEQYLWSPCAAGTEVEHLKIYGGGHAWPGARPADSAPTAPISAANAVWSFFRERVRAPGPN